MKYLIRNLKPYAWLVVLIAVLLAVQGFGEMSMPTYTQNIIDTGIQNRGIEHILPTKTTAEEYEEAQIFMNASQKKQWKAAYKKSGKNYVRKNLSDEKLESLDDQLLTPIVLSYRLGHTTPSSFRKMMKQQVKQIAEAQKKASASGASAGISQSQAAANQAASSQAAANQAASSQAAASQAGASNQAALLSLMQDPDAFLKKIDSMSVKELADLFQLDVKTFKAKDENGKTHTYVDIRPAMQQLIDNGQMSESTIKTMRDQMNKTVKTTGSQTMKSMAIRYAYDAEKSAGVDVDAAQISYLWACGRKMIRMAFLMVLAAVFVSYYASKVGAAVGRDLRAKVFGNVIHYSNAEIDRFQTSSLITRATNDVQQVQMVTTMMLRMVLYAPVLGIWGIVKVYQTHANMSCVILLGVAVIMAFVLTLMKIAMPKFKIMQTLVDKLNGVSREILTGLMVIRAFGRQKKEEERFDDANTDLMRTQLFTNRVMTFMMPSMMLIMNGLAVLITWVASHRVNDGTLQVGAMTAFITYAMIIISSFMLITVMSIVLPRAGVAAERIDEVCRTETTVFNRENAHDVKTVQGELVFDHVDFKYPGAEENVLSDISFTAKPGETTAIIGSTGSGKSTLVNLIPRFYDVTGGKITLDGTDIRDLTLHSLRDQIGFVPQKGILFSGSIAENIRYGRPDAPMEEVERAAKIAQAEEFIEDKDEKYDSWISQGGSNVSGGQKQRLAIARAIAKRPGILVFDDSFSALDMKTDAKLREVLAEEEKNTTRIVVAQRISTILNAEQIIVLDDGKIAGCGTNQELLETCPVYQEIASSQLSEKELEAMRNGRK